MDTLPSPPPIKVGSRRPCATSQLSSPVSSHRLSHAKSSGGYTTLQCSRPPHSRLTVDTRWQQFFRRLANCDAPSQPISLVLITASLELLGFEIRSRQAISIPKRKMLLVSPLRRFAQRAVDRGAFAISRSPSRQARNGLLLTLSKLHFLSSKLQNQDQIHFTYNAIIYCLQCIYNANNLLITMRGTAEKFKWHCAVSAAVQYHFGLFRELDG